MRRADIEVYGVEESFEDELLGFAALYDRTVKDSAGIFEIADAVIGVGKAERCHARRAT